MGRHIVLVGGGHAHLGVIRQAASFVQKGHRLTVVSPDFHFYSGMGPGLLTGQYSEESVRIDVGALTRNAGGHFIEDTVVNVAPAERRIILSSGDSLAYDVLSFNTGSSIVSYPTDSKTAERIFKVKPIANLLAVRDYILKSAGRRPPVRVLVVGGGPAGCEVAGNLQALAYQDKLDLEVTLVEEQLLMPDFPSRTRRLVLSELLQRPLHLYEGCFVRGLSEGVATLDTGQELPFDILIQATGVKPSGPFKEAGLAVGPHGGLSVNAMLHTTRFPEIFAAGDCLFFQPGVLPKIGVHAVRQSRILKHNLLAALESRPLRRFHPRKQYLLVLNLGLGRAVATGYGLSWRGKSAAQLKTCLDRRFVKRFHEASTMPD